MRPKSSFDTVYFPFTLDSCVNASFYPCDREPAVKLSEPRNVPYLFSPNATRARPLDLGEMFFTDDFKARVLGIPQLADFSDANS